MKLRNKKTGEILESVRSSAVFKDKFRIHDELNNRYYTYDSLAKLNEEWEDLEERFYWIDYDGNIHNAEIGTMDRSKIKEIGNYFETKEEAENAVEKLKAWKRLKDNGLTLKKWLINELGRICCYADLSGAKLPIKYSTLLEDLDLLLGVKR